MKPTLRCSELDRVLSCFGSVTLVERVQPRQGEEGDEGTAIHWHIANRLIRDFGASGEIGPMPKHKLGSSEWIVGFCIREIADNAPATWSLEVEVPLAYEFEQFILSGHIDALSISPDGTEAIGWDWKTVYLAVDLADMNEQVLGYIVLLKRAYPMLRKVTFFVVQPRISEEDGIERVSKAEVEFTDMGDRVSPAFEARINNALAHPMELNTGRKQCRFCDAALQCPALTSLRSLMKLTLTTIQLQNIQQVPNDETLANWVIDAKTLSQPLKDAQEIAATRIKAKKELTASDGTRITLKITDGSYEVPDRPAFYRELRALLPSDDRRAEALSFSMTRIKDELADNFQIPKTGKAAITAQSLFDAKLRPLVKQGTRETLVLT